MNTLFDIIWKHVGQIIKDGPPFLLTGFIVMRFLLLKLDGMRAGGIKCFRPEQNIFACGPTILSHSRSSFIAT